MLRALCAVDYDKTARRKEHRPERKLQFIAVRQFVGQEFVEQEWRRPQQRQGREEDQAQGAVACIQAIKFM